MPAIRNCLIAAFFVAIGPVVRADNGAPSQTEQALIEILRSEVPLAEKAITCKKLAIHGSAAAVPELAKLLAEPALSSWVRIALEVIPSDAADQALRDAAESLEGELLVGTINSIGVRRDTKAVEFLTERLQDRDADVAAASAVALGHIGNPKAAEALREALPTAPDGIRSAVAEGCVLCAEQFQSDGSSAAAIVIYDEVRSADVPMQCVLEATRGAILARKQAGVPLLLELFRASDRAFFRLALSMAREFPGRQIDRALAVELPRATPGRGALIVQAMSDRQDTVYRGAILQAAEAGPKIVRVSAIEALSRVGNHSCLDALLKIAVEDDPDLVETAKDTLAVLPGQFIDEQIAVLLPDAEGNTYVLLIEMVGRRRIHAVSDLLKALEHSDGAVRHVALTALGETVDLGQLNILIAEVIDPVYPEDREVAQLALKTASVRMSDRNACALELARAVDAAPSGTKSTILEILSDVGGTTALQALAAAAKGGQRELLDTSSRLLGKWNGVDAAPVLFDLAATTSERKYRIRALRGYIGLARKFSMVDTERTRMCRKAFDVADRIEEKKLVLDVLKVHPSAEGAELAIAVMVDPQLHQVATGTVMSIAEKLGWESIDMTQLLSGAGIGKVDLEIIRAEYGAGTTQADVTELLQEQAGDLPLITLATASYNSSLGGDPVPGTPKQLRIQYRINGRSGEASFEENVLIFLPMPE